MIAQRTVSFPTADGGIVYGDVYGGGSRGVLLAHGGQFNKESWKEQAKVLTEAGFLILAIDFRGYGQSRGPGESDPMSAPLYFDVLAGVRYLRSTGAKTVSVVGASLGGWAAGNASIMSDPEKLMGWCFWVHLRPATPRSLRHVHCSLWLAMAKAETDHGSPESARSTRRLLNRRSWSSSMGPPTHNSSSKRTRERK
jgi:esterase/lipase